MKRATGGDVRRSDRGERPPRWFAVPLTDALNGLELCLGGGWRGLALIAAGMLAGWWVYVPVHELLHAAGCWLAGGAVRRLEIGTLYGGAALARVLPFVVGGSDYAGRLSGFDTRGSDLVYLATDLCPFLLSVFPGVWWLRRAARGRHPVLFGASLPVALAPFLSLTGDAYEIGSILVTRLPPWAAPAVRQLLRGDDLGLRWSALSAAAAACGGSAGAVSAALGPCAAALSRLREGCVLAALAGLGWALLTYGCGAAVARAAGQPALRPAPPPTG